MFVFDLTVCYTKKNIWQSFTFSSTYLSYNFFPNAYSVNSVELCILLSWYDLAHWLANPFPKVRLSNSNLTWPLRLWVNIFSCFWAHTNFLPYVVAHDSYQIKYNFKFNTFISSDLRRNCLQWNNMQWQLKMENNIRLCYKVDSSTFTFRTTNYTYLTMGGLTPISVDLLQFKHLSNLKPLISTVKGKTVFVSAQMQLVSINRIIESYIEKDRSSYAGEPT